ncbi:PA3611 family quorum-sensing-regulated virulence factor [Stutzerimonas tarimensis]|uniref:PA3611 family quorum-sensing-regulated virulence factor n=1 Tax=Stutzerimonas tarimensis TaxID=1507735 RepID=A0ABV7SZX7_9GAMM
MKPMLTLIALCLVWTGAQAQTAPELDVLLDQVAAQSNVGTPRAINEDLLDLGYTVEGSELVNHISVQPRQAAMMGDNPGEVRAQLSQSVCGNTGLRELMSRGATLRYEFVQHESKQSVTTERFSNSDC